MRCYCDARWCQTASCRALWCRELLREAITPSCEAGGAELAAAGLVVESAVAATRVYSRATSSTAGTLLSAVYETARMCCLWFVYGLYSIVKPCMHRALNPFSFCNVDSKICTATLQRVATLQCRRTLLQWHCNVAVEITCMLSLQNHNIVNGMLTCMLSTLQVGRAATSDEPSRSLSSQAADVTRR